MNKSIQTRKYNKLLKDISSLYDVARHAVVEAYWKIGQRIVEEEQHGEASAVYGEHLLVQLSKDLSARLGSGFSERNLYNMRQFYLTHEISQLTAKLTSMPGISRTSFTCRAASIPGGSVARASFSIRNCWTRAWQNPGARFRIHC